MGAPIRSSNEIDSIINRGQHSLADVGYEIVNNAKLSVDSNDPTQKDRIYRLILLRAALQNLLTPDGVIKNYYLANEIKKNKVLDVIAKLAKSFDGTSIPFLGQKRIPLYFFPSSSGLSSSGGASGGPASPGGVTFQNASVDAPGEVVDSFPASDSEFAFYIYSVRGSNASEGNRTGVLIVSWRGTDVKIAGDLKTDDTGVGLNTTGVTFTAAVNAGLLELTCNVPTDNWVVKGTRILFQNISFQNPLGPLPAGGTTGQMLRKSSNQDYETEWFTLFSLTSGYIPKSIGSAYALADSQLYDNGTNIGIGNPNPSEKLHIQNGNILLDRTGESASAVIKTLTTSGNWDFGINNGGNGTSGSQFFVYNHNSAAYLFTVQRGTGYVGIGTAAPEAKLDVDGDVKIRTLITSDQSFTIQSVGGTVTISGAVATPGSSILLGDSLQIAAENAVLIMSSTADISLNGNVCLAGNGGSYGGAIGVVYLKNAAAPPGSNPVGGGILYTEAGALKYRGSSGTITPLALA